MLGIYVLEMRPTQAFPFDGWIACCYSSTCRPCCQKVGHVYTSKEKAMTLVANGAFLLTRLTNPRPNLQLGIWISYYEMINESLRTEKEEGL